VAAGRSAPGTARTSRRPGGRAWIWSLSGSARHRAEAVPQHAAGGRHRCARPIAVALVQVDRGDRILEDLGPEAESIRVERRRADAVVGRQPDDDNLRDALVPEELLESRGGRVSGLRVLHREAGVAVLAIGSLVHGRAGYVEIRVQGRAP